MDEAVVEEGIRTDRNHMKSTVRVKACLTVYLIITIIKSSLQLHSKNGKTRAEINVIRANRQLEEVIRGKPKMITIARWKPVSGGSEREAK